MPISFDFTFPTDILTILWFITYGILIIGCISLRKDERNFKFVDLLLVIGALNFAYGFIRKFIPRIETIVPVSALENDIAFSYNFTFFVNIILILLISLGFSFVIFGRKNHTPHGIYILLAGIILIFAYSIELISSYILNMIVYHIDWYDPTLLPVYTIIHYIILLIDFFSSIIGFSFILYYGIKIKQTHFMLFGVLSMARLSLVIIINWEFFMGAIFP